MNKQKLRPGLSGLSLPLQFVAIKTTARLAFDLGKATDNSLLLQKSSKLLMQAFAIKEQLNAKNTTGKQS